MKFLEGRTGLTRGVVLTNNALGSAEYLLKIQAEFRVGAIKTEKEGPISK